METTDQSRTITVCWETRTAYPQPYYSGKQQVEITSYDEDLYESAEEYAEAIARQRVQRDFPRRLIRTWVEV
jgi:hypothetical protein